MKTELYKQLIEKQKELIEKLHNMVDSGQDYDRDYHDIWIELSALERQLIEQIEQPETVFISDEEIEKEVSTRGSEALFSVGDYTIGFLDGAKWYKNQIKVSLRDELVKFRDYCIKTKKIQINCVDEQIDEYLKTKQ
jgi:hypothetical protein